MLHLYKIITTVLYPLLVLLIYLRKIYKKEDSERYKEKIFPSFFRVRREKDTRLLWFHASSIGELNSILPILEKLNKDNNFQFLITTTTLSSSELAKNYFKNFHNFQHRFLPLDVNFLIRKFINGWKPDAVFLVDSEIWPNLIMNISKKKIPLILINARLTFKTFERWNIFPKTAKKIFCLIDLAITANHQTLKFLEKFNLKNIHYFGNIKLFSKPNVKKFNNYNDVILQKNKFWMAVSTHDGEEVMCLKAHLELKKKIGQIITIIAPRHISRVNHIKNLCDNFKLNSQIIKFNELIKNKTEVLIINSFGVLNYYFNYAKSIFVGKSTIEKLKNVGGQNPIDAAKLGCKIYHGKYTYNFEDIYKTFQNQGISKIIFNEKDLSKNLIEDLNHSYNKDLNISKLTQEMGVKVFSKTIKTIEDFIFNDFK